MSAAALDRLLAILVAALLVTGLLTLRAGSPPTAPLFVVHGVLAGSLVFAVALKLFKSTPAAIRARRWAALARSSLLAVAVGAALLAGFVWVGSGRIIVIGPWTLLTVHVLVALAIVPILVAHLLPRRWRVLRPPSTPGGRRLSRRTFLSAASLGVAGLAAWTAANVVERAMRGARRFTGSRWLPDGGIPPATTFFGEPAPALDPGRWRLTVSGAVERPLSLSLVQLAALGEEDRTEVLDCTSGWALRTHWRGTPLGAVLDHAGASSDASRVEVRSSTGWYARMSPGEAATALLATRVAGELLPAANGAPCRLVVRDRRGLEWVKWVTEVRVS